MKKIPVLLAILLSLPVIARELEQKNIYLPREAAAHDTSKADEEVEFGWDVEKWDPGRMVSTENIAVFWAPGFGDNVAVAPDSLQVLENGDTVHHDMKVDLPNLLASLERFYRCYRDTLKFTKPGSKADRYKMMVMLDYSLEGTAYGGDYDGEIGALWIAPNRLKDPRLNCIAHELGHSFQSQITCDGDGEAWGGNGFFEMTSQWMLMQVNPDWITDENYHLEAFKNLTHKAFQHIENIYHSPYVIEYWSQKYGKELIGDLYREGKRGEDPAATFIRHTGMTQAEFNDDMWLASAAIVNFDLDHIRANARPYANRWPEMADRKGNTFTVKADRIPEAYGFNFVEIKDFKPGETAKIKFCGEPEKKGAVTTRAKDAGWRYGFVASMPDGSSRYSEIFSKPRGTATFRIPEGTEHLWLVVMGAPTVHRPYMFNPWDGDGEPEPDAQFPWSATVIK